MEEYRRGWDEALREVWQQIFPLAPLPAPLNIERLKEVIETTMDRRFEDGAHAALEAASYEYEEKKGY